MVDASRITGIADEGSATIAGQIDLHRMFGWNTIELRTVEGTNVCEMDDDSFNTVAEAIEEAEFRTVAFGSAIANWSRSVTDEFERDVRDLKRAAPRMHRLGTRFLRIMSYTSGGLPEEEWSRIALLRVQELTRVASGEGIVLVHENCDGWASAVPGNLVRLLEEIPDPALQIVFDPGNPVAHGQDPKIVWDFFHAARERIIHFHIKDCYRNPDGKVVHCYPGEGQCEVLPLVQETERSGYQGFYSIEPHMTVQIHKAMDGNGEQMAHTYTEYARRTIALLG